MRGSAVPTIVWSMAASSAASIRPIMVPISCGRVSRTSPEVTYCGSLIGVCLAYRVEAGLATCEGPSDATERCYGNGDRHAREPVERANLRRPVDLDRRQPDDVERRHIAKPFQNRRVGGSQVP